MSYLNSDRRIATAVILAVIAWPVASVSLGFDPGGVLQNLLAMAMLLMVAAPILMIVAAALLSLVTRP